MRINAEDLHELLRLDLYEAGWKNAEFPGISSRQVAMNALDKSFLKKFHNDVSDRERDNSALALFLECNEKCRTFGTLSPRRLDEELIIGEMKVIIDKFFFPNHWDQGTLYRDPLLLNQNDIALHFGLGNGSNIGPKSTDLYSKICDSLMSHTRSVSPEYFRQTISDDKLWSDVEAYRATRFGYEIVPGSRLSFVPKSRKISRTICTEPSLNMLYQKGIAGVLTRRLSEVFGINLSTQPVKNASLARLGSITNEFGTIDLKSASDSISMSLCRQLIPEQPLNWLLRTRSPTTTLPGGLNIELHMISSMGNGYTFPLQTMIFASLVMATYKVYDIPVIRPNKLRNGNFAVFGDDIIVDRRAYNAIVRCLEVLGFSVNLDKSFNEGYFRESCGSDFISGHNVRGVYIQKLLDDGDSYSAINRLNRWSAYHGILLPRVIGRLRNGCRFIGVPYDEADDAGIKIPMHLLRTPSYDINRAIRYLARVNIPSTVYVPSVDVGSELSSKQLDKIRRKIPTFTYNADGLLMSSVAGWLRSGSLGLRVSVKKAVLRKRICPCWDECISGPQEIADFRDKWKFVVDANLVS